MTEHRLGWREVLGGSGERARILVVDDEIEVRRGLQRLVTRFGYSVRTAASAEEADQWLNMERFDVCLLDIELPRMKGVEFLGWALSRDPELAVIMLTGLDLPEVAIECLDNSSGQGTVLSDPIRMATYELETYGRAEATKAIIVLSDGKPTNSASASVRSFRNYCQESYLAAEAAKAKGIEVFTVGFGLDGANDDLCSDTASPWSGKRASDLLAAMATDSTNDGCPANENDDGDHFFCLPKTPGHSPELSYAFQRAVTQLTSYSRLVQIDD